MNDLVKVSALLTNDDNDEIGGDFDEEVDGVGKVDDGEDEDEMDISNWES